MNRFCLCWVTCSALLVVACGREQVGPTSSASTQGPSSSADGRIVEQSEQLTQSITRTMHGRSGITPFFYFAKLQGYLAIATIIVIFTLARRKAA